MKPSSPTPHPDVNEILNLLLTNVKEILRDQFVGMYLYGSLANGDFDQHSDIDALVVLDTDISKDLFETLKEMRERMTKTDSPWAIQLEVSYIPLIALRRYDPPNNLHPHIDRGSGEVLHIIGHDSDWIIQRSLLRERGMTITGPDPNTLIDAVAYEDLRWAVLEDLHLWFKHFLDDPHKLQDRDYQSYTVLTLYRILYFESGSVLSKPAAVIWAGTAIDPKWIALIESAWEARQKPTRPANPEDISDTLEFIRYTLGKIMNHSRFKFITPKDLDDYDHHADLITDSAWPEFMLHDPIPNKHWHELFDRFEEYQFAMLDTETNRMAAMGNSVPFYWDQPLEELPESGWDWVFLKAIEDHKNRVKPTIQSAIQIAIHPDYQNQGLSMKMVKAMSAIGTSKGFKNLVAPVRPNQKSKYPLIGIDDYFQWKTEEGLPFDAWLRVHVRAGARLIKPCHEAMTIRGTRAEWEQWTGMKFMQSGEYFIPGALNPMEMDLEKDEGLYVEPNVWMVHEI